VGLPDSLEDRLVRFLIMVGIAFRLCCAYASDRHAILPFSRFRAVALRERDFEIVPAKSHFALRRLGFGSASLDSEEFCCL
jgi:hypothetical protein